ncbi:MULTISPECIES: hypothetical protein [Streptomyces]|uniref:Integral membrane protein n=1 Tax=Streptomyces lycii TaxID=2654337 RepID=A0ABQ7FGV7_9ACTN|nr:MULTISPECIES: hypothetical protein [Streptomyces]KAF4408236.1 hypothetical protein GCU69_15495 [Streptomyces lycii]PGH51429.1 hypothetical protein CRI70_06735 [Streptomyces sp. Ru87]
MAGNRGTRHYLERRLALLLTLIALSLAALLTGYHGVHRAPGELRGGTAPAILETAAARTALQSANLAAQQNLTGELADVVGKGEDYRTQISAADQSLSKIVDLSADAGHGEVLPPVRGQFKAYTEAVDKAAEHRDDPDLRDFYLENAQTMLVREGTGILHQLEQLQRDQQRVMVNRTSFGPVLWTVWGTAVAALLALAVLLVRTQLSFRRRFRRRYNVGLLAATLLLGAAALPAIGTYQTQQRLDSARVHLESVVEEQRPAERARRTNTGELTEMRKTIRDASRQVRADLLDTDARASAIDWIWFGGCVTGVLVFGGMQIRITDYRFPRR